MTRALYGETPKLATTLNNLGIALLRRDRVRARVHLQQRRVAEARIGRDQASV